MKSFSITSIKFDITSLSNELVNNSKLFNTCSIPSMIILLTLPKSAVDPTTNVVIDASPVVLMLPKYAVPLLVMLPLIDALPETVILVNVPTLVILG